MCTRDRFHASYMYIQTAVFALAGALVAWQISYAKRRDIFDEFARENLKTTDTICLKIAYTLMVIAAVACIFSDFSGELAGYCIIISILLLTILRAVIFTVIDQKACRYNPSLKLAMDIAKVFHVTVEDLFEFTDDDK